MKWAAIALMVLLSGLTTTGIVLSLIDAFT